MTPVDEYPALIPTTVGPIGVMVTVPQGEARFAAVVLQGRMAQRFGVNQLWARVARGLAGHGGAVLRLDYPGRGESHASSPGWSQDTAAVGQAVRWFRDGIGDIDLLAIGSCYGARLATWLAGEFPGVVALGLVVPPFGETRNTRVARATWAVTRKLGRLRPLDKNMVSAVTVVARRAPTWMLVGEGDLRASTGIQNLRRTLDRNAVPVEIELVPGTRLHGYGSLRAQQETLDRLVRWAARRLEVAATS